MPLKKSVLPQDYRSQFCALQQTVLLADDVDHYLATQNPDGSWQDLTYTKPVDWTVWCHVNRLAQLARAYTREGHQLEGSVKAIEIIRRGVDHWLQHRYEFENWWYNSIGVPCEMLVVGILLDAKFEQLQREGILSVLDQAGKLVKCENKIIWQPYNNQPLLYATGEKHGANVMWLLWIAILRACLHGDAHAAIQYTEWLWDTVQTRDNEGFQEDGSYYLHGARLQNFHYGLSHFEFLCEFAWIMRNMPQPMPREKRQVVTHYLMEGCRWMCRGAMTVPGTLERAVTRPNMLKLPRLSRLLELWLEVAPEAANDVKSFIAALSNGTNTVQGFRYFPFGDFSAYHQPQFSVFVKTLSTRTEPSESYGDNLRGMSYLHCGDHYMLQSGDEYYNIQPIWEWSSLPGLTVSSEPSFAIRMPESGGVGNGESGCAAMNYARQEVASGTSWSLRKFWAFHQDTMICLLGGWRVPPQVGDLTTSLEQCYLREPIHVAAGDTGHLLADGDHKLDEVRWVLHNHTGYLPLSPSRLQISLTEITGTWGQINAEYMNEPPITAQRLLLKICHEKPLIDTGFVLVGGADAKRLNSIVSNPPWVITANNESQQSLQFADGTTMAAFYNAGVINDGNEEILYVDRPCLAVLATSRLWLASPDRSSVRLQVIWKGKHYSVQLPANGQAVHIDDMQHSK